MTSGQTDKASAVVRTVESIIEAVRTVMQVVYVVVSPLCTSSLALSSGPPLATPDSKLIDGNVSSRSHLTCILRLSSALLVPQHYGYTYADEGYES